MEQENTDTPSESLEPTSNQDIELLIDEEGIMSDTSSDNEEPLSEDNQPSEDETPSSEQKDSSEQKNIADEIKELVYEPDEELDKSFVIKVNGELMETSLQELKVLAQKGMSYSAKTMALAKHKDLLGSLEQYGISSVDDLNNFINTNKGEEIKALPESKYDEGIEQVASEILERDNSSEFKEVISGLPEKAIETVSTDARVLAALYTDFDSGLAQKLLPETKKIMSLRPDMSFEEAYNFAGNRILGGNQNKKAKVIQQPRNSFVEEHSDVLSDDEFNAITAKLSGLQ